MFNLQSDDPKLHLVNTWSDDNGGTVWLEKDKIRIESWRVTKKGKTLALLFRGKGLLPICSESGVDRQSFSQFHPLCPTISRKAFTKYGLQRSKKEGYTLPPVVFVEKKPGQTHASHAEVQLMHWFIQKNLAVLVDNKNVPQYRELSEIRPSWRCPVPILASSKPCHTCKDYARHIASKYPVDFVLRPQIDSE
jgi:hypothetical protein